MDATCIYTIDIGDENLRGGVWESGTTRLITTVATPKEDKYSDGSSVRLMDRVRKVIDTIAADAPPMSALAVSASGIMTLSPAPGSRNYGPFADKELYVVAPNVDGLKYKPLVRLIEDLGYNVPVHVENDVNAALESDTAYNDVVCIALGAGMGAAAKKGGEVIHIGNTWSCFEIGHGMRWQLPEHLSAHCHCGSFGCLEAAIGGWAMTERYKVSPEKAPPQIYDAMRQDVVELLPQAIASVIRQTSTFDVVMAGRGGIGYARNSNFLEDLRIRTEALVNRGPIRVGLLELGDTAELQGTARALIRHGVLKG